MDANMRFFTDTFRVVKSSTFKNPLLRRQSLFHLKQHYYHELGFSLQLGWGFVSPFYASESLCSFSEIFFEGEYESVFSEISLPDRWLDLGCHYGYFSLYVAWLRAKAGLLHPFQALLVDADHRVLPALHELISQNNLQKQFLYLHGAIAEGSGSVGFREQSFMSSMLDDLNVEEVHGTAQSVPIVDQNAILALMPPPYDLLKVDVEGGEYDFLTSYGTILDQSTNLVVEWHSWHRGGGSAEQIKSLAESRGFRFVRVIREPVISLGDSQQTQCAGVFLFTKSDNL
jgi:FkbM family methyltransferase